MKSPSDRHLSHLLVACHVERVVPLPGNGSGVAHALKTSLMPRDDERCGTFTHSFQYGGSVPEGWAESTVLILPDAFVETMDYDVESNTFVTVRAVTEARADEIAHLVEEAARRDDT